jgi:hypothetical protein
MVGECVAFSKRQIAKTGLNTERNMFQESDETELVRDGISARFGCDELQQRKKLQRRPLVPFAYHHIVVSLVLRSATVIQHQMIINLKIGNGHNFGPETKEEPLPI